MNQIIDDNDVEEFFDWLRAELSEEPLTLDSFEPDAEMLELAWQVAKANQEYINFISSDSPTFDHISLLAADDGDCNEEDCGPFPILQGDGSLTVWHSPDDSEGKIIRLTLSEHRIDEFQGRRFAIVIAGKRYNMSEVSWRGIAQAWVPKNISVTQIEYIDYTPSL